MSLAQDIYIQFLDYFSSLGNAALLEFAHQKKNSISHHHYSLILALNDVLSARGL